MEIELTPYELNLILTALSFAESNYDGEESFTDMGHLEYKLHTTYGWGGDEGKDKYTDAGV